MEGCQLSSGERKRMRKSGLCLSKIMTILIHFHQSHYRCFKRYYQQHVPVYLRSEFPGLVSYTRFVELMPRALAELATDTDSPFTTIYGTTRYPQEAFWYPRLSNIHCGTKRLTSAI